MTDERIDQESEAGERRAVTGFVLSHFMNRIVDGVEVELFCDFGDVHLAFASAFLGEHTLLDIGLCVPNHFADHFCKTCGVVSLLNCLTL